MRTRERNKRTIKYANYVSSTPSVDANGLKTGQYTQVYSNPKELYCNISPATGNSGTQMFGVDTDYSHYILTGTDCPIDETTRIWYGVEPNQAGDNYNFVVSKVAKGFFSTLIAIKEVKR